jgi:tetratricopeptide (TPR) repeat protein
VLLDRKRVKFWQKWVFGFMAVIMAAFLVMIPIQRYTGCGGSTTTSAMEQINKDITKYKQQTTADPSATGAWQNLAESYLLRANQRAEGSDAQKADWLLAVDAYKTADDLLAKQTGPGAKQKRLDNLANLASVYLNLQDYNGAIGVYQTVTDLKPKEADGYFNLGEVASQAGDKSTALLAFTKFLELDPTSPYAQDVKDWMSKATASPTPAASANATVNPSPSPSSSAP